MQQRIIKKEFPLISIIDQESLNSINNYLKKSGHRVKYSKKRFKGNVFVERSRRSFDFFNRLMREKPGFNKHKECV